METVQRDYAPKGVKFFYIYKALAHPEQNGYITPFTQKERLMHVAEAKKKLGTKITWICDSIDNDLKHALGDAPNSEFIIDPEGRIVKSRSWSDPQALRADLAALVGEVKPATTIAQVGMKPLSPPKTAAKGVVPRLKTPDRMTALVVKPVNDGGQPFYAKLRAEAEQGLLRSGTGKLYLGFFLDPLYEVHWNNRSPAIQYELDSPAGVTLTPSTGKGPSVKEASDADPREFLIEVQGDLRQSVRLTVKYFACDDAETFCKPVTQTYEISLTEDKDGGWRRAPRGGSGRPNMANRPGRPNTPPPNANRGRSMVDRATAMFKNLDRNGDGKIDRNEAPARSPILRRADANGDGVVELEEMIQMAKQRGGQRGR